MLRITYGKGFHLAFSNGVTVSVQFGPGNYCDNYNMPLRYDNNYKILESEDAEVAAWYKNEKLITKEILPNGLLSSINDEVGEGLTADEVFEFIRKAKEY